MKVQLIGMTVFLPPADVPWEPEIDDVLDGRAYAGQQLAEYAGRACYQSWDRPNPKTATNKGYLKNIIDIGHESVLEHGVVTFDIQGVSRSLTHELVRHRHLSFSQLSQRYVPGRGSALVEPDVIADDPQLHAAFVEAAEAAEKAYDQLLRGLEERFADEPNATLRRKQARQAARAVLPNATETKIVVTGNYRAWRHFVSLRATEAADVEIRALAVEILRQLKDVAPNVFQDFLFADAADGTTIAEKD